MFPQNPPTSPVTAAPKRETQWCIPKVEVGEAQLQTNIDYICGSQVIDCGPIQPGGACYEPNTLLSHAAFAMNLYYQKVGRNPWNCDFSQTAMLTSQNPSKFSSPFFWNLCLRRQS